MDEIRLGTIGSGFIVHDILKQVKRTDGIRLEAVYSRNEETGRSLAEPYGAEKVCTDLAAFLSDPAVNTVYIATPNALHYRQTKEALSAGKHVICEKPFCLKADQVRELKEISEERGLLLAEAVPTVFLPNLKVIRKALKELGRIRLVAANYSQYSSRYDRFLSGEAPNVFQPLFGGGCLMDINYYNLYLTVLLFGLPDSAVYHPNLHANGIDTSGIALLSYPDFQVSCVGAKDADGENSYQIEGEKGFLNVIGGSNGLKEIRIETKSRKETVNLQPDPDRYSYEVRELTRIFLEEERDVLRKNLETTFRAVFLSEQLRKSAGLRFPED